jgi:O-antigen ligase
VNKKIIVGTIIFTVALFFTPLLMKNFFPIINENLVSKYLSDRYASPFDMNQMSNSDRIEELNAFAKKISKKAFFGHGQGSTVEFYFPSFGKRIETKFSHNSYLVFLLNFGIVGTIIIFIALIYPLIDSSRKKMIMQLEMYKVGFNSTFFSILVISMLTANLTVTSGFFFIGFYMAILSNLKAKNLDIMNKR